MIEVAKKENLFFSTIQTYLNLTDSHSGEKLLKLTDWNIKIDSLDDPLDPNDHIWGSPDSTCKQEVIRLRTFIRDAFIVGSNVALTELARTLTRSLPLPPIDFINGLKVNIHELHVLDNTIAVTAGLKPGYLLEAIEQSFSSEMQRFQEDLNGVDLKDILHSAPSKNPDQLEQYLQKNVPAYKNLKQRNKMLLSKSSPKNKKTPKIPLPQDDLFIGLSGSVFDALAKDLLKADISKCTEWFTADVLAGYARGRGCYWFSLSNARGGLNGTKITMGCSVKAGGKLELQLCIRIPCAPDQCVSWSPGIGLKGPLELSLMINQLNWINNKALLIYPSVSKFPGLEVYGLPPGVGEVVNKILNFISSVAFVAFFNALVKVFSRAIISVPIDIPKANVKLVLSKLGATNMEGLLVLTGKTDFS